MKKNEIKHFNAGISAAFTLKVAMKMYDTYCTEVGGKAFNGDELPQSAEFFADESKLKQSLAWIKAARTTIDMTGDEKLRKEVDFDIDLVVEQLTIRSRVIISNLHLLDLPADGDGLTALVSQINYYNKEATDYLHGIARAKVGTHPYSLPIGKLVLQLQTSDRCWLTVVQYKGLEHLTVQTSCLPQGGDLKMFKSFSNLKDLQPFLVEKLEGYKAYLEFDDKDFKEFHFNKLLKELKNYEVQK